MKKIYSSLIILACLFLLPGNTFAQLSGLYSINQNAASSATNFTSISAFTSAINSGGVSGAVTVNIVPNTGPYNEQPMFGQISGASTSNSIVLSGNGKMLSFTNATNSAQPWVINLNGTDYMSLNNLSISGSGSYAMCLVLSSGANYNSFNTLTVTAPATHSVPAPTPFSDFPTLTATRGSALAGNPQPCPPSVPGAM